ncbi:MAG: DHH family phosphoesterase [Thermoanaerobaculia bacterium]
MITELTRQRHAVFSKHLRKQSSKGRWLILTHDNPDPDSIAAAAALRKLLRQAFHRRVTVAYGGIIGRAENQEMVRVLGIRLSHVRRLNWKHYGHFALVDTQPGTGNNQLPKRMIPEIVFDHHPMRRLTQKAAFTDIRPEYGATATILAEYLLAAELEITKKNATALVYAIRTETQDFGREFTDSDKAIYNALHAVADMRALARIRTPRLPVSYFCNLHEALESLQSVSTLVVSRLGEVEQPDIVPEIADLLLRLNGKTWSLATGLYRDRVYLSIRTTNSRADAGRLIRRLLGSRGKGGGHGMMAGGWVPVSKSPDGDPAALQTQLAQRLARMLKKNPDRLSPIVLSPAQGGEPEAPRRSD